jgi:hypothetical protein
MELFVIKFSPAFCHFILSHALTHGAVLGWKNSTVSCKRPKHGEGSDNAGYDSNKTKCTLLL